MKTMLLCYAGAYLAVTAVGILHTVFNITVLHMKSMKDSGGMGEGYEKTKPWHAVYNILIFPAFACVYFGSLGAVSLHTAISTSLIWGAVTIVFDVFGWVLVKHPWSLTFRQFYVEYQPWISLIYLAIFASPFIAFGIMTLR